MKELVNKAIQEAFKGDMVQELVTEQIEKTVKKILEDLFGRYGDASKIIEKELKEQMIPQIEKYNFKEHIIKLDTILTEVVKAATLDHKKILENFESFISSETPEKITLTELHEAYCKHCSKNIETTDLEIDYDDDPCYEYIECNTYATTDARFGSDNAIKFTCSNDKRDELEKELKIYKRSTAEGYGVLGNDALDIAGLKRLDEFDILLLKIKNDYTTITISEEEEDGLYWDDIEVEAKPECYME